MAKIPHEALHRIFRGDPGLFTRTLRRVLAVDFPEIDEVNIVDTDLTTTEAIERRADTIIKANTAAGPRLLVIEPQTEPKNEKIADSPTRSRHSSSRRPGTGMSSPRAASAKVVRRRSGGR